MKKLLITFCSIILFDYIFTCTIGLMYDNENRPVIWKNRDRPISYDPDNMNSPFNRTNEFYLQDNDNHYDYLAISTAADFNYNYPFMGINEMGFGVVNSYVGVDVETGDQFRTEDHDIFDNDDVIRNAFMHCESIDDFVEIVESIELIPHDEDKKISSNFIAIDRFGNSIVMELYVDSLSKKFDYEIFDMSTNFIIRTNKFEFESMLELNPDSTENLTSYYRYDKSGHILNEISDNFNATDLFSLDIYYQDSYLPLLRNYSRDNLNDYEIPYPKQTDENDPYGYFFTDKSINRARTVSSMVIQGVNDSLDYLSSKVWVNVGNPITSPYFSYTLNDVIANPSIISTLNGSTFSLLANQIREILIDYSQGHDFKSYIDSYLIDQMLDELYSIESEVITPEDAYTQLLNFSLSYSYNCSIGVQKFNGRYILTDQSKHNPEACEWKFYDDSGYLISSSNTCFNPDLSYPLNEVYYNMSIEHSVENNGNTYVCDPVHFLAGDLNQDSITNILDLIYLSSVVLNNETSELTQWEQFTVNLNSDEHINVSDLIIIVNFILDQ